MRVAIIGAGFGGMAAAYDLRKAGHDVVVFDARQPPQGSPSDGDLTRLTEGRVVDHGEPDRGRHHDDAAARPPTTAHTATAGAARVAAAAAPGARLEESAGADPRENEGQALSVFPVHLSVVVDEERRTKSPTPNPSPQRNATGPTRQAASSTIASPAAERHGLRKIPAAGRIDLDIDRAERLAEAAES